MRFVERFRAKSTKARQAQSKLKSLEKMDLIELSEDEHSVKFSFPSAPHSGRDVLMLDGISKSYGEDPVFSGVDLQLQSPFHHDPQQRAQRRALVPGVRREKAADYPRHAGHGA